MRAFSQRKGSRNAQGSGAQAVLTVEAALVVPLVLFSLFTVLLVTFYLRDRTAAAARIRTDCMAPAVTEKTGETLPVFTLTTGTLTGEDGHARAALSMAGVWPMGTLSFEEEVSRPGSDVVARLRRSRADDP